VQTWEDALCPKEMERGKVHPIVVLELELNGAAGDHRDEAGSSSFLGCLACLECLGADLEEDQS
jgi:hypothetical protein